MNLAPIDIVVLVVYAILILSVGLFVSRPKKDQVNSSDYFLASKSLPWWAVGASLIAANISAEQFIGMSGGGFVVGLAIASYEWMAALTLIIVGKYFLPIFIEKGLYTIPEFLEKRYNAQVKSVLAVFWVALFVLVNLTSVLYLGATALDTIMGEGDGAMVIYCIIGFALFTAAYSLWGGLSSVVWTDVIQVVLLIVGGLITTGIALTHISPDESIMGGFQYIFEKAPEKFDMILDKAHKDYNKYPGIAVLVGGMWVANIYYWGFNQYIIQRTLAAKSLKEAQKGIVFAAILKMIVPLIVIIPGIIAYTMFIEDPEVVAEFTNAAGVVENDRAYPWLISKFIPAGLKGLILAALAAAIVSSLASMLNSTSTIFTMDLYKPLINKEASEKQLVKVGRLSGLVALIIAVILAPLLDSVPEMFQYIQEYTGIVSPGILAIFILGLFWKKATARAAIIGAFLSIPIAMFFKIGPKGWSSSAIFPDLPFMHQMGITFLITTTIMIVISLLQNKGVDDKKGIHFTSNLFKTDKTYNILSFGIILLLIALYSIFW
ncbi:MAG: SSS family solute:Na+ symporter [Urechidicola sp.]|jgi:SSS family solute:Na+ symporter|tara:strand:+ start:2375 stop:4018 length:1644 start_codon:yes stop_codon:yes gene_type:complete